MIIPIQIIALLAIMINRHMTHSTTPRIALLEILIIRLLSHSPTPRIAYLYSNQ